VALSALGFIQGITGGRLLIGYDDGMEARNRGKKPSASEP